MIIVKENDREEYTFLDLKSGQFFIYGDNFKGNVYMKMSPVGGDAMNLSTGCLTKFVDDDPVMLYNEDIIRNKDEFVMFYDENDNFEHIY